MGHVVGWFPHPPVSSLFVPRVQRGGAFPEYFTRLVLGRAVGSWSRLFGAAVLSPLLGPCSEAPETR